MNLSTQLKMTTPLGGSLDVDISYHDIGPQDRSPQLALVAGLSGGDLNGMFVLSRLASLLSRIANGERSGQRLCERLLIIPTVNVPGAFTWDRLPLDRGSECNPYMTATLNITRQAYYRVNIHNATMDREDLPQVLLYDPNDDERATACLFGLPAVIERPVNEASSIPVVQAWREYYGENFVIQAGQGGQLQLTHCEVLFRALAAFLQRTGIVEGLNLADEEEDLHYFGLGQTFNLFADHPGIFVSRLEVGRWVQVGERIGHIYDGFTGEILTEIFAPVSGLLSSLRRQPLLLEGALIGQIQMAEGATDNPDLARYGQMSHPGDEYGQL